MEPSLDTQAETNGTEWTAFLSGQFHTAYGLLAIAGLSIATFIVPEQHHWFIYLLIFGFALAILADLWANGYTH
jgi:hypothetical protein